MSPFIVLRASSSVNLVADCARSFAVSSEWLSSIVARGIYHSSVGAAAVVAREALAVCNRGFGKAWINNSSIVGLIRLVL